MIKAIVAFMVVWCIIVLSVSTYRELKDIEKWNTFKVFFWSGLAAMGSVAVLSLFVALF